MKCPLRVKMYSLGNVVRRVIFYVFKVLTWIPVVFIMLVLVWGYYVYVYIINLSGVYPGISESVALSRVLKVFFLLFAHLLLLLLLASYYRTIFTGHKTIPECFYLSDDQLDELDQCSEERAMLSEFAADLPVQQLSYSRSIRYCSICELIKPDRCHHCSVCNRCILKMDHHCPWVNNCVGFSNYKYFLLFLVYSVALCFWLSITALHAFIATWTKGSDLTTGNKFQVIFWYFVCVMFGLSALILLCFHAYLVLNNKTTLENMQTPMIQNSSSNQPFFVGYVGNFRQVFGKHKILALLPTFTSEGDGVVYHTTAQVNSNSLPHLRWRSSSRDSENSEEEKIIFLSEREPLTNHL